MGGIVHRGDALQRTCYTIVCIVTRLQLLQFSQLALPSLEFLSALASELSNVFLCVIALPLSAILKGHKIVMGFLEG